MGINRRKTLHFFVTLGILLLSHLAQAQITDVNVEINQNNTDETVTIEVPTGAVEILRLTVYDPDYPDEGLLYINGQGPITLFPGGNGGFDGETLDIDIRLTDVQKTWFQAGTNSLRFTLEKTAGYIIESIAAIGEVTLQEFPAIEPVVAGGDIPKSRQDALKLYKRLVGVTTPIDSPVLEQMATAIEEDNLLRAAQFATEEPGFLNLVVRDMAAKMSTREETVKTPLNDFIATFIGAVRDGVDARELLRGNFYYMASPTAMVPRDISSDLLSSNNHFEKLETDGYDLGSILSRVNGQQMRSAGGAVVEHPDPAGILTSRAFMEAHASAGTNRRLVEYTMRAFTCNTMENWSDAASPDIRVGRDVDRFPGGDGAKFQSSCKACHANMDGFRGAFARFDFSDGFTKYATLFNDGDGEDGMPQAPIGISSKLNQNTDVFPSGFQTTDDTWQNFARSPANQKIFGWRGTVASGAGVGQFGSAVADTRAFSMCLVKRVFSEVCRREPAPFENAAVESLASGFEGSNYNLKLLFETVSVRPECAGL